MSSPAPKSAQTAAASKPAGAPAAAAPLQPVLVKATPAARTAQHAIPALVLALFLFRFDALVADPVSTMTSSLPIILALQTAYVLICLPVAGSAPASKAPKKPRPGEKKKPASEPIAFVAALLSFLLTLFVTPFFHATMILFGAPLLTHLPHTFLCAAHLTALSLFPLFYVHGVDSSAWLALAGFSAPFDEAFGALVGAVVGAWLGAVPIPLDWDREWQKWPVTILCGIYGGWALGKVLGGSLLWGKKF
ncbi:hypothetical protein GQ53DRAFT_745679 [Thozetella sp. PMI_491]|nr:hypothetical protein GQ53DRAFT_745679 [Thozetella sp. PMI_491]